MINKFMGLIQVKLIFCCDGPNSRTIKHTVLLYKRNTYKKISIMYYNCTKNLETGLYFLATQSFP